MNNFASAGNPIATVVSYAVLRERARSQKEMGELWPQVRDPILAAPRFEAKKSRMAGHSSGETIINMTKPSGISLTRSILHSLEAENKQPPFVSGAGRYCAKRWGALRTSRQKI
jgi:hypothetical protein